MKKINQFKAFLIMSGILAVLVVIAVSMERDQNNVIVRAMNDAISVIQRPFVHVSQGIRNFGRGSVELFDTFEENERLRRQMYHYQILNIETQNLREEVEALRAMLDLTETLTDFEMIPVMTVGRDIHTWDDFFIVNSGSIAGVEEGMAVLSTEGYLIGKVTEVSQLSSRVHLIKTHNDVRPHVVVSGLPDAHGILYGFDHDLGSLIMSVHLDAEVEIGDAVMTTGLGGVFPRGLLVGYITHYETSSDGLSQILHLENNVNYHQLDFMFIIKRALGAADL